MNSITFSEERNEETCYGYCNEYQPHVVKRMFDYKNEVLYDLRWDDAGNLGQVSMGRPGEMFEKGRFLFWTEDNRMHTAVNGKYYSYYAYDYGGERRLKLVGVNSSVDVNAEYMTAVSTLNEPTLYPSAYMVLTNKGYTKHYYAGTERVAARLGGGGLNARHHVIENDRELQTKADSLFDQCLEQVNSRVLKENDLECIMRNKYAKEEFGHWIEGIPYQMKADVECDHRLFKEMVDSMLTDYHNGEEKEVYFYHSDHLGSASWITDSAGIAVQHLQYLPYGEPYIDQRAAGTTYRERFRFTGKEKDEETGYGYFGARYMDYSLMTSFISVDRYASKYPFISPYAYCAWNPIRLIDPTGDIIVIMGGNGKKVYYSPGMEYSGSDGFVKQTVSALNTLNGTDEGSKIINGLHTSNNTFSIHEAESGENRFVPSDVKRAMATQIETDPMFKQEYEFYKENGGLSGGSGGDVFWYPDGTLEPTISGEKFGVSACPVTDLGHELSHAYDANYGKMDYRIHEGISRNDWMAVYRENLIRQQLKQPLRTHYSKKLEPDLRNELRVTGGSGTFMLNDGKPYLPQW